MKKSTTSKKFAAKAKGKTKKESLNTRRYGFALQGGGAHGACTAGALVTLLDSGYFDRHKVTVVSGTSAGAMNGAVLTHALNAPEATPSDRSYQAARALEQYWNEVAQAYSVVKLTHQFNTHMKGLQSLIFPFARASLVANDRIQRPNLTPQEYDSLVNNPMSSLTLVGLQDMLKRHAPDIDLLRGGDVSYYANAVTKKEGSERADFARENLEHVLFGGNDLSYNAIVSSGALKMFGGQNVNGRKYWDGAYLRNPDLDVFDEHPITDLLVFTIQDKPEKRIKPMHQDDVVAKECGSLDDPLSYHLFPHVEHLKSEKKPYRVHSIELEYQPHWGETTRYNTHPKWLAELYEHGQNSASQWLKEQKWKNIARPSSQNITEERAVHL